MRVPRVRFTVRRMMAVVASVALVLAFALDIYPSVGKFLTLETSIRPKDRLYAHTRLVVLLTAAVALPLLGAATLASKPAQDGRGRRPPVRRLVAASALVAIGVGVAGFPVDGMRVSQRLGDGSHISYLYRYRLWPGRHTEFCLEVISTHGQRRYLISRNDRYFAPKFLTDADQSVVWLVDPSYPGHRSDGVLCSLDLVTGRFVGPPGPHPAVVTETGGLGIVPPVRATRRAMGLSGGSGGQSANRK